MDTNFQSNNKKYPKQYFSQLFLATLVEGEPKALFSIATTPRRREGTTSFTGLHHFTLNPYLIELSAKQGGIKYHFLSLWYDSTCDWTLVSQTISKHSTHKANHIPLCQTSSNVFSLSVDLTVCKQNLYLAELELFE